MRNSFRTDTLCCRGVPGGGARQQCQATRLAKLTGGKVPDVASQLPSDGSSEGHNLIEMSNHSTNTAKGKRHAYVFPC